MNFTLQDILGAALAFYLFPLVIVFPGYVFGWLFDLFDFRLRRPFVRLAIGLALSFAISPIVLYLTSSLISFNFALLTLGGFALAFAMIAIRQKYDVDSGSEILLLGWRCCIPNIAILSLINIQWTDRLYLSVTSFDQTTRVAVIEAMTRTGVPPVNPGYYPGHAVPLTFSILFLVHPVQYGRRAWRQLCGCPRRAQCPVPPGPGSG